MKSINNSSITLLDCTLRDGGYYTNWNFDQELVTRYANLSEKTGINIVELGYLRFTKNMAGPFSNIPNGLSDYLGRELQKYHKIKFAAMLEIKEFKSMSDQFILDEILTRLSQSVIPIKVLRFAVHFSNVRDLGGYIQDLQAHNLEICINIMQIDLATSQQVQECISYLAQFHGLSAVYIADSLGSLNPEKVTTLIHQFKEGLDCAIGFHAHDNMGLALHNSIVAIQEGATWIDSTINGMGRGAGNAKTEQIISIINPEISCERQIEIYAFAARYFNHIHKQYGWGATPFYGISGVSRIHPTYVQLLENNISLNVEEKLEILSSLVSMDASLYSSDVLDKVMENYA